MPAGLLVAISVAAGAVMLILPALWNGYPFLYPDTGTYLWSGFQGELLIGRPMMYGLFLRWFSFGESLWYALWVQCLLISGVFHLFAAKVMSSERPSWKPLALLAALCATTGIAPTSSQLLPDAWTPLVFFLLWVLLESPWRWSTAGVVMLLWAIIATHNSHGLMAFLFLILATLVHVTVRRLRFDSKKLAATLAVVLLSFAVTPLIHLIVGGTFDASKGEHVFLLNRTREVGALQAYLKEACPDHPYDLCGYQDLLDGDFMWDQSRSPLYALGGWEATETSFNRILVDMSQEPRYVWMISKAVMVDWIRQFFSWQMEDMGEQGEGSSAFFPIQTYLPNDLPSMTGSRQGTRDIHYQLLNGICNAALALAFIAMLIRRFKTGAKGTVGESRLLIGALLFVWSNAVVCATFSIVIGRYQSRVIWLLLLVVMLLLSHGAPKRAASS